MHIAAVKIAQKQAQLSDPDYRALLQRVAGVTSSKQLTDATYNRVLAELYHIAEVNAKAADRQRIKTPAERKLWALWYDLTRYLPSQEQRMAYFVGIVRRAANRADLQRPADFGLLTPGEMYKAVEALKLRLNQEQQSIQQEVPF